MSKECGMKVAKELADRARKLCDAIKSVINPKSGEYKFETLRDGALKELGNVSVDELCSIYAQIITYIKFMEFVNARNNEKCR
ncbi:hypothetical protein FACS189472_12380 [Alphaproteobacteria bacterium]|nr:hypothetical protein FACS189472_12380 [Alphaproteobacteria bacterium]